MNGGWVNFLFGNIRMVVWVYFFLLLNYTFTANHICSLQRICRLRAHVKTASSADDRTKAQIESAKTRLRIHSIDVLKSLTWGYEFSPFFYRARVE